MTLALIVVTLASLAMAAALLMLVWRLLREERRRSTARVTALEAGIRGAASVDPQPAVPVVRAQSDLFGTAARPARASRSFGLIAAVGLLIVGTAVGFAILSSRDATPATLASGDHHTATTVATIATSPLELVSLRHRRDGDALSITGVVRNPIGGGSVQNLTAVVFLFDRDGGFLASGRAPIDYTSLVPGDESPFVVTVKEPGAVGRYRVSFRTDAQVIPHIDRREDIAVARSVS